MEALKRENGRTCRRNNSVDSHSHAQFLKSRTVNRKPSLTTKLQADLLEKHVCTQLSPIMWHSKEANGIYLDSNGWIKVNKEVATIGDKNRINSFFNHRENVATIPSTCTIIEPPKRFSNYFDNYDNIEYVDRSPVDSLVSVPNVPIISPPLAFQDDIDIGDVENEDDPHENNKSIARQRNMLTVYPNQLSISPRNDGGLYNNSSHKNNTYHHRSNSLSRTTTRDIDKEQQLKKDVAVSRRNMPLSPVSTKFSLAQNNDTSQTKIYQRKKKEQTAGCCNHQYETNSERRCLLQEYPSKATLLSNDKPRCHIFNGYRENSNYYFDKNEPSVNGSSQSKWNKNSSQDDEGFASSVSSLSYSSSCASSLSYKNRNKINGTYVRGTNDGCYGYPSEESPVNKVGRAKSFQSPRNSIAGSEYLSSTYKRSPVHSNSIAECNGFENAYPRCMLKKSYSQKEPYRNCYQDKGSSSYFNRKEIIHLPDENTEQTKSNNNWNLNIGHTNVKRYFDANPNTNVDINGQDEKHSSNLSRILPNRDKRYDAGLCSKCLTCSLCGRDVQKTDAIDIAEDDSDECDRDSVDGSPITEDELPYTVCSERKSYIPCRQYRHYCKSKCLPNGYSNTVGSSDEITPVKLSSFQKQLQQSGNSTVKDKSEPTTQVGTKDKFGSFPRNGRINLEYLHDDDDYYYDLERNSAIGNGYIKQLDSLPCNSNNNFETPIASTKFLINEAKRKSSSLPKSFQQADIYKGDNKSNSKAQHGWRKHGLKNFILNKKIVTPASAMSGTAPTTPTREFPDKKRCSRLMKMNQYYSSTPSLDENSIQHIDFDCDTRYLFKDRSYGNKAKSKTVTNCNESPDIHPPCQNSNIISGSNFSDRVFQRFCKSLSLRFLKKVNSDGQDVTILNGEDNELKKQNHRFGPLSWRSSKERKERLHSSSSVQSNCKENDANIRQENGVKNFPSEKRDCQLLVRRTLSDLNGYRDVAKHQTASTTVPTKYKPPVPVLIKKHRQFELRRTVSQPSIPSRFSPLLTKKNSDCPVTHSEDERGVFSEDDMMSDSGSSIPSRKTSLEQGLNEEFVIFAEAVWDHIAIESEELPFKAGDVIEVYNTLDKDWWWGTCCGKSGWFPSDFVRLKVSQEDTLEDHLALSPINKRPVLTTTHSNDQVRSRIVLELINTERDFVKILDDILKAHITECRNSPELFTLEQTSTIFGNWEQLFQFQSLFLRDLENSVDWDTPCKSCVGNIFLTHRENFCMYSDYCNNHPLSIATLQQLYQNPIYKAFFEKCRIKGGLIEIPLDGFLLTPVQRICKYPLQLAELLKYTEVDHPDHGKVKAALDAMKNVAILINERKRRMESLEKLILWQQRVDGWEGEDLIERSSQLIHQSEVSKVATGILITNATLFLFDHQLVYCRKDILKKNYYIYKGRIVLDNAEVIEMPDGKDHMLGFTVRNGIRIQDHKTGKWVLFCCRTQREKRDWMEAFNKEKSAVVLDKQNRLEITATDRHLAYITASTCNRRRTFVKHNNKKLKQSMNGNSHMIRGGSSHLLGRKVGTWFIFGANRKNHRRTSRLHMKH